MTYAAKTLADSLSPDGVRLTTFEVTFPRIVLAEFNTHRMFSRNSASSRAIPVKKMIERVMENPYVPEAFGSNKKGMQAGDDLSESDTEWARKEWLKARDMAVISAKALLDMGVHKQLTNRLLEPFMWHTVIVTGTEWSNFFHLRDNEMAHPGIATPAKMMRELYDDSRPRDCARGEWHLPLVYGEDFEQAEKMAKDLGEPRGEPFDPQDLLVKVSVGRCARVSYLTHDGKRDPQADIDLHDRLLESGHMSPFEHVARPMTPDDVRDNDGIALVRNTIKKGHELPDGEKIDMRNWERWSGNFRGWVQYRKTIPGEADIIAHQEDVLAKKYGRPF